MQRLGLALLCLGLAACPGVAQGTARPAVPSSKEDQGTYLGILFSPVPESVYAQLPALKRELGVLVTHVLPDSPAARANLSRNDIVVEYSGNPVRDAHHLARLIRASKPDQTVELKLLRGGKSASAKVKLTLGPVLTLADELARPDDLSRGTGKSGGPAPVTVSASPLENNRMRLTIEYQHDGSGRYRTTSCVGSPAEIDRQIMDLPPKVQDFARVALRRIRELNFQQPPARP